MKNNTYLNDRFFAIFGILTFSSVLSLAYPPMLMIGVSGFLALAWMTWKDWRGLVDSDCFKVTLKYPHSPELGQQVSFRCRVFSSSPQVLELQKVKLDMPALERLFFAEGPAELRPEVREGGVIYQVDLVGQAKRLGYETIRQVTLSAYSRHGLWFRRMEISTTESPYRVMPTSQYTGQQLFSELVSTQRLIHQGNRYLTRSRAPYQFHSIREYQYPDSIRHIDHKRTAKFNRLMTRVYDRYHNHHLIMALDLGRSMRGELAGSSKHDYYLSACLVLAQNAFSNQDHVSFFAFSQQVHYLIPKTKAMAPFQPVFQGHSALRAREEESNYDLLNHTVARIAGQRSIVLIFTDATRHSIQETLENNLASLCRNHLTVVVTLLDEDYTVEKQVLNKSLRSQLDVQACSRLLYAYWLDEQVRLFQEGLVRIGGAVLYVPQKNWLSVVTRLYSLLRQSYSI